MEGPGGYKKQQDQMLSNFGGNSENVSIVVKDEPDVHYVNQQNEVVLPHGGLHYQKMPQSYFQFLAESSSFLRKANSTCFGEGFSEILKAPSYNNSGMASGSKSAYSLPDTFAWNLGMQPYMTNEDNPEASPNVNEFYNLLPNVKAVFFFDKSRMVFIM